MTTALLLGGPGTGKTRNLVDRVDDLVAGGVSSDRIAFVSFTNAAIREATGRVRSTLKWPWFRTVHSLAFNRLGKRRSDILTKAHLDEIGEITGETFLHDRVVVDGPVPDDVDADHLLQFNQIARATGRGLELTWQDLGADVDFHRVKRFHDAYEEYREDQALTDYTDLLEEYVAAGMAVPVDYAIIDEAQDLTNVQWDCVSRAFSCDLLVAGDDDQSVYEWSGASVERLISLAKTAPPTILAQSHRVPSAVWQIANEILHRLERRVPKSWLAAPSPGRVEFIRNLEDAPLEQGSWLVLARTRWQAWKVAKLCEELGYLYSLHGVSSVNEDHLRAIEDHVTSGRSGLWHDVLTDIPLLKREYYLAARRRGEKLRGTPRLRVNTIHGSKGMEAENVLIMTDLTRRVERGMEMNPDAEHRLYFVGVTRARRNLWIVEPSDHRGYRI